MANAPLEPGSYVHSHCTRCKAVLRHTVVALVGGKPVRVKCNTCGGEHAYRVEAPAESPAERPRKTRSVKAKTPEAQWNAELAAAAARGAKGRPYATSEAFRAGDVLDHPAFGVGLVQRAMGPGKILVLFRDGARSLICRTST